MRSITAKLHAILIRLIILVLILFMISIGLRIVTHTVLVDRLGMDNAFTRLVLRDETKAPRDDRAVTLAMPGESAPRAAGLIGTLDDIHRRYTTITRRITNKVDTYANQQLMFRRHIVEAANRYEKLINWNLAGYSEYNNVIDLGGGYLTTFMNWTDVWGNVEAVQDFKQYLDAQGIPMLFVQLPNKIPRQDKVVNNVVDFYNDNADRLVGRLRGSGVNTLDLRDTAEQLNLDYRSLFYNTDHHWRSETGLWAAGVIGGELNRSFGYHIDPALFDPANYTFERYEKAFLGSLGKKVTLARATPDDFTLIYPKFDVNLSLRIPSLGLDATGGFDVIFDHSQLEIENLYESNPYGMYLHSAFIDHDLIQLENNLPKGDTSKVLILGDSFGDVLVPFMGLQLGHIDFVDLRNFEGSLRDMIAAEGYDMVIIIYSSLFQVEYNSGTSMYDFR